MIFLFSYCKTPTLQVNFPTITTGDADAELDVSGSVAAPKAEMSGEAELDLPELQASDVNLPSGEVEVDVDTPEVKVKGKKGGFHIGMPKFGAKGKGKVCEK